MGQFSISRLIKFGQKEHLESLLKRGEIFMNNIEYFRKYEEDMPEHLRGDKFECFDLISQHNVAFIDNNPLWKVDDITIFGDSNTWTGYLFCMYAVHSNRISEPIDKRMLDFGDYALIIYHPLEFINRIKRYCNDNCMIANCFPIIYYDEMSKDGLLLPFNKRRKYSYQNEARVYIHSSSPKTNLTLNIGSIEDIAKIQKLVADE